MDVSINYWAVLVAAVVNMVVGFLWYGPIFGKMWIAMMGWSSTDVARGEEKMKKEMNKSYALAFLSSLVMAYVLAYFVFIYGAVSVGGALELAFWIWLGFMATISLSGYIWEGKPFKLFVLNAGEQLVALALMALVLVLWQ